MYAAKIDSENELVILDDGSVKIFRNQGDVIALSKIGAVKLADCLNKIIPTEQSTWAKKLEAAVDDAWPDDGRGPSGTKRRPGKA